MGLPTKSFGQTNLRTDTGTKKSLSLHGKEENNPPLESLLPEYWTSSRTTLLLLLPENGDEKRVFGTTVLYPDRTRLGTILDFICNKSFYP